MKVTVKVGRGYEMEAEAVVFAPKGWLYLNFSPKGKICIDMATGEIIKGQCYMAPVLCAGEKERVLGLFR